MAFRPSEFLCTDGSSCRWLSRGTGSDLPSAQGKCVLVLYPQQLSGWYCSLDAHQGQASQPWWTLKSSATPCHQIRHWRKPSSQGRESVLCPVWVWHERTTLRAMVCDFSFMLELNIRACKVPSSSSHTEMLAASECPRVYLVDPVWGKWFKGGCSLLWCIL